MQNPPNYTLAPNRPGTAARLPEIPRISDRALRDYCSGKRGTLADFDDDARMVEGAGLASRAKRLRHLVFQYERLMGMQAAQDRRDATAQRSSDPQLDLVQELRRLLDAIALEAGDRPTPLLLAQQTPIDAPRLVADEPGAAEQAALQITMDRLQDAWQAFREAERLALPMPRFPDGQV